MAFRDRLGKGLLTGALGGVGGKGLLTGALGGGRIGGALSGVGDILQESFGGLGSGGIFGGKQRARRRADAAAQEADLAQASDPSLQVDTVDTIDSTGLGTVGMNEIAMEDPMLTASVNGRNFSPYSKKGTPIVDDVKKLMNPDKPIRDSGQGLNVDEDDVVTKSDTPGIYKGDIIRGLDKDKKGYVMDYDYEMKPSSTKQAKEAHPPSIFARDYKTFDAKPHR
tara:strand:+ start:965 stop:1636 length:672 start_codon:yes stop_codon:yes gene_type:complete